VERRFVAINDHRATLGLFVELETFVVDRGRRRLFDAVRNMLASAGFDLTLSVFARAALGSGPGRFVPALLDQFRVRSNSQARLGLQIAAAIRRAVCSEPPVRPGLPAILQRAQSRGVRIVALSLLDAESATHVAAATGLTAMGAELAIADAWRVRPSSENVLVRSVVRLGLAPPACVAFVTCAAATEAALCAGMRVVAFPDEFTSFQPFTGADEILDTWSPETVQSFLGFSDPSSGSGRPSRG